MLEHPKRRNGQRVLGLWVTVGFVSAFAGITAEHVQAPTQPDPGQAIQAGPIDETLDYIDCLVKRLLNLPCDGDEELPTAPPIEPIT